VRGEEKTSMNQDLNRFAIFTDLYELTMAAAYYRHKMFSPATFSLFIRDYPSHRAYFVSAGLEDVLAFLEDFHFSQEELDYLSSIGLFSNEFLHFLSGLRFTGDVYAMPEGRVFFKDEPIIEVSAPIIEGQLIETFIINAINFQVSIATKASRCIHAAQGRDLVDFSLRRTPGTDSGLKVARSCYIAGFGGTSNALAGQRYGIPVSGTMAHSFITAFEEEIDSFRAFAQTFPENTVLLIDTYDTVAGAWKAVEVAKEMRNKGQHLRGVRLDSGDMAELSKEVRTILDHEGLDEVSIFASGGFDEYKIAGVLERGAQINAFGVGTKMGVSADAPYTDMAYKLVQYDGRPVLKLSTGKKTLVGKKQVFRTWEDNKIAEDTIALRDENLNGESLLTVVMKNGNREQPPEPLQVIRERFREEFASLDTSYKDLEDPDRFPVKIGPGLKELQKEVAHAVREKELGES
jgi:nicotinate phosphoribosyltransferase